MAVRDENQRGRFTRQLVTGSKGAPAGRREGWGAKFVLGLLFAGAIGCAHAPARPDPARLAAQAFSRGDVLSAYRLLRSAPPETDPSRERERLELQRKATLATEHLIEMWLERSEELAKSGNPVQALRYLEDLLYQLPADDPLQASVAVRVNDLDRRLVEARGRMDFLVDKAEAAFQAGQIEEAYVLLNEASATARAAHLSLSLTHERLKIECERRTPRLVAALREKPQRVRERPPRVVENPPPPEKEEIPPSEPPPEPVPTSPGDDLYKQGVSKLQAGQKIAAIALLQKALLADPQHEGARRELKRLSSYRTSMVQEFLGKAAEHFAREELELAAPYYERVLEIEPENLRAKEGVQMFQRLRELKKKQPSR